MKKLIAICLIVFTIVALGLGMRRAIYTNKVFVRAGQTDSITNVALAGYNTAELQIRVNGTDSVRIITKIYGYYEGTSDILLRDTFLINESNYNTHGFLLRGYSANYVKGFDYITVVNEIGSIGVDDSTGLLKYSMQLLAR